MVDLQARQAWAAAAAVLDPEVPAVTVADLGILRSVEIDLNGRAIGMVTPTYWPSGDILMPSQHVIVR